MTRVFALLLAACAAFAADGARAQTAQDFYKGRQITLLVSTAAGGGYDPAFLSDAQRLQMEIDPLNDAEIEALLAKAYNAPKDIVAAAAKLVP